MSETRHWTGWGSVPIEILADAHGVRPDDVRAAVKSMPRGHVYTDERLVHVFEGCGPLVNEAIVRVADRKYADLQYRTPSGH